MGTCARGVRRPGSYRLGVRQVFLFHAEPRSRHDLDVAIREAHGLIAIAAAEDATGAVPPEHCVADRAAALGVVQLVEGVAEIDVALLVELDVGPVEIGGRHGTVSSLGGGAQRSVTGVAYRKSFFPSWMTRGSGSFPSCPSRPAWRRATLILSSAGYLPPTGPSFEAAASTSNSSRRSGSGCTAKRRG